MKLTDSERKILWHFQNQPDMSVEAASKRLRIRPHQIHYCLAKFRELQVIRRLPVISAQALGFYQFDLLFTLGPLDPKRRQRFVDTLIKNDRVARFMEVGGDFEYRILLLAKTPDECVRFLEALSDKLAVVFERKQIFITNTYLGFGRKYLTGTTVPQIIVLEPAPQAASIDELDHRVLQQLSKAHWLSNRDNAQALGVSASTFSYRLKGLEQRGVFRGFIYGISAQALGRLNFQLLIQAATTNSKFSRALEEFAKQHDLVVNLVHYLGPWDFSLQIEPLEARSVVDVIRELQAAFTHAITRIISVPQFRNLKNTTYPFDTWIKN